MTISWAPTKNSMTSALATMLAANDIASDYEIGRVLLSRLSQLGGTYDIAVTSPAAVAKAAHYEERYESSVANWSERAEPIHDDAIAAAIYSDSGGPLAFDPDSGDDLLARLDAAIDSESDDDVVFLLREHRVRVAAIYARRPVLKIPTPTEAMQLGFADVAALEDALTEQLSRCTEWLAES